MHRSLEEHLAAEGPKRILALDGGGIRGVISLEILRKIEEVVGSPLSDTFDLIGGTSTGSIIAAGLALGWPVERLQDLYRRLGETIFQKDPLRFGLLRAKFPKEPLERALEDEFKDIELGDSAFHTGLAIVAKRLDTNSPWVLHNNPRGPFYDSHDGHSVANRHYLVRLLIRASTAAPHYFDPEHISVTDCKKGTFVDGGVSPHNNPALQLLLLATLRGYGFRWPLGEDRLLVVSVGTGSWAKKKADDLVSRAAAGNAFRSLVSMMDNASDLNRLMLQWMSRSPTAGVIDSEIGDLSDDLLGGQAWLRYLRYDAQLEGEWFQEHLPDRELDDEEVAALRRMDSADNLERLVDVGRAAAADVRAEHFPTAFLANAAP